jgi:hypothetical protein
MGIADLFRPKYRHSDVRVRAEAVRALTNDDAAILIQVARTDRDIGVRRIAIEKIGAADVLADIASAETERSLRDFAGERAAQLWMSIACSDDVEAAAAALGGISKLGDQRVLVEVAVKADSPLIRKRAFGELRDPRALCELAKRDAPQDIRLAAVGRIDDGDVLRALAIDTTAKEVGLAAVEKLDDKDRLENVAQKAKNKAVRQRARKIVGEIDEAEQQKKPGVPDDVKRRRAEKAQLVRELEAVADTFDFEKIAPQVRAMEEAWGALAPGDDGDERFAKAAERFWKRKDLYDQQARTSQELRVVEREAREEKERVAVEKERIAAEKARAEASRATEPADVDRSDDDTRRDQEARRAADEAEREAKKKEGAERSAAIVSSLIALCEDMEQLAGGKQGREIDRLLQQAQRAFEQIGKVIGDERDKLTDRYTAARGKLVVRAKELREAEDWARFQNVPKAEALIQTAKQLLEAETTPDLGNKLRQMQALWKEIGPMPQRRSKELWEQFKGISDQIYEKVKAFRSVESEKFADVAKVKEALIAEAEALADAALRAGADGAGAAGDFAATAEKLKGLQAQWKQSGFLPRKHGDELWKRFRAACDRFFERRKPLLDARRAEEAENLARKQALIERATEIAAAAPGEGGWGKAIVEIKELQRQWKDIGFVPRRDADTVWTSFRRACDSLFEKRDAARDAEANAHRAERDAVAAEIAAVIAGTGDDFVTRAIAVRGKARELGGLTRELDDMVRHVIGAHPEAVKGTELDPVSLRGRRERLIEKASELSTQPGGVSAAATAADIAAQLQQALRANAFGDLRFSGRDPVEVVDELRVQWAELGPILGDDDRALADRFAAACARVHEAAPREPDDADARGERGRRRRQRRGEAAVAPAAVPVASPNDAITAPATFVPLPAPALPPTPAPAIATEPPPVIPAPSIVAEPPSVTPAPSIAVAPPPVAPAPARPKSTSMLPPMDDLDTAWDLPEDDPTARKDEPAPPSASEMAGDSATGGDGIDEPGWD